jgi:hypothetical protein
MSVEEWFNDTLRESGHRPLFDFVNRHTRGSKLALDQLKWKWDVTYVVEYQMRSLLDASNKSIEFQTQCEMNGWDLSEWTSFRDQGKLYFLFRDAEAATVFRLYWS